MKPHQLKEMQKLIQEQVDYKSYLWEQANLFEDTPTDINYIDYSNRYYDAGEKLKGMLHIYAIATNQNYTDLSSKIELKEDWK